jgi:hypothetical protein
MATNPEHLPTSDPEGAPTDLSGLEELPPEEFEAELNEKLRDVLDLDTGSQEPISRSSTGVSTPRSLRRSGRRTAAGNPPGDAVRLAG